MMTMTTCNDNHDNDNDNDITILYSTDDSLRDCNKLASLTSKLARVDHHIDFMKQCLDSNVIPTGLTLDVACNVIEKSQTEIDAQWSTILKDASKSLMKLSMNHYCRLKTILKQQICEISARMCSSGDPLEDSSVPEVVKTRLRIQSLTANNKVHVLELKQKTVRKLRRLKNPLPRNRNLQNAVGSYYDLKMYQRRMPSMSLVQDVTIGEGESVPPCTEFTKTWRIRNSGSERWPEGSRLRFVGGDQLAAVNEVKLPCLRPGEMADISVLMMAPSESRMYHGQWQMCTQSGENFGEVIWVIICVEVGGALAVTQRLSAISTGSSAFQYPSPVGNPFGAVSSAESSSEDVMCTDGIATNDQTCGRRLVNGVVNQTMDVVPDAPGHSEEASGESQSELDSRISSMFGSSSGSGVV